MTGHGVEREWTGADNEVWSYGEEAYEIFVKYIVSVSDERLHKETDERGS